MDAKELIKLGQLSEARKKLTEAVRSSPSDSASRTLLTQVLAFSGEWDKAESHLETIALQDPKRETGVQVFKNLVHAEKERAEVYRLERRPACFGTSPPYLEKYCAALSSISRKNVGEALELFEQIDSERPPVSGRMNDVTFSGFKDTDAVLSLVLEVMLYERYLWVPFESIREVRIERPKTLFDLLWIPTHITLWEGLAANCYTPVIYPDSSSHDNDRVKLGRITEWVPLGGPFSKGMGQHVFETDESEVAVLEIRDIVFDFADAVRSDEQFN